MNSPSAKPRSAKTPVPLAPASRATTSLITLPSCPVRRRCRAPDGPRLRGVSSRRPEGGQQAARGRHRHTASPQVGRCSLQRYPLALPRQRRSAALVELLPCPRPERVVEVRHSDFPPLVSG